MRVFRGLVDPTTRLLAVVKADAYGHGILLAAEAFLAGGADVLGVHTVSEGALLRGAGITAPILVLGPAHTDEAEQAMALDLELTVSSLHALRAAAAAGSGLKIHIKVDTGVNRQGLVEDEVGQALDLLRGHPGLRPVGLSSHFADIEDTTDHTFAKAQMKRFVAFEKLFAAAGLAELETHMTCSAATLLWTRTHGGMARVGISAYGIWPSRETRVAFRERGREDVVLTPALTWKVAVSQIREVAPGETVGYGRSWKAMAASRIAVLPVGYSDGWPRMLSGRAHVLLHGRRAPLVGRVCMNLCMVDVTHIPEAAAGDQAVLLGVQGDEVITAEMLGEMLGTIPYEVLTLPGPSWTRIAV